MNKKGITTIELIMWVLTSSVSVVVFAYSTFNTKETANQRIDAIDKRLDKIETLQVDILREIRK